MFKYIDKSIVYISNKYTTIIYWLHYKGYM